jgi:hypothetical protein
MGNTKDVGDRTESAVLAALIARGCSVAVPFGDNDRYDLVAEVSGSLHRVQCKTGWIEGECIRFKTASETTVDGEATAVDYGENIDVFAVRCRDTDSLYWVPRQDVGRKNTYLRRGEPEIDHPSVNRAAGYALSKRVPTPDAADSE